QVVRDFQRGPQSGDAAADYENVREKVGRVLRREGDQKTTGESHGSPRAEPRLAVGLGPTRSGDRVGPRPTAKRRLFLLLTTREFAIRLAKFGRRIAAAAVQGIRGTCLAVGVHLMRRRVAS